MTTLPTPIQRFLELFMSDPWIYWGIGPAVSSAAAFFSTAFFLEWCIRQPWCKKYLIVYGGNKGKTRAEMISQTQKKVPFKDQLKSCLRQFFVDNLPGVLVNRLLLSRLLPVPSSLTPSLPEFSLHFFAMMLVADFGLYWGHRIQHRIPYLWKNCHSVHHRLQTPTPVGTVYIEPRDSLLQAVLPILLAELIIRPHPVTLNLYIAFHLANNAFNHSGIDGWWMNLISLKFLPLRCGNTLHDAHHQFSNYGGNPGAAKNFGEMFWLWDYVFGTLSQTERLATTEGEVKRENTAPE